MCNMKKNVLITAVLATLATSVAVAQSAPQMGQISFTGNITDVACKVNGADSQLGGKFTQVVLMGDVPQKFVKTDNAKYDKSFEINFSECSKTPQVTIKNFTSAAPYLKLTGADTDGVAKNVGIALFNGTNRITDATPITVQPTGDAATNTLAADFKLLARYIPIQEGAAITPGSANAIADIEVTYN